MCLAQGHNVVMPVRLKPITPRSSQALSSLTYFNMANAECCEETDVSSMFLIEDFT